MKVCFFNFFNNGDVHVSRGFVSKISKLDISISYWHKNNKEIIKDIGADFCDLPKNINQKTPYYKKNGIVYINTWYGCYKDIFNQYGTSYRTVYESFRRSFDSQLGLKLDQLGGPEDFLPSIDYSRYNIDGIDDKLEKISSPKVLFCNNKCLSGQAPLQVNMNDVLLSIAKAFPSISFIASNDIQTYLNNVHLASKIINKNGNDLNEISYISRNCDVIISTSSGPGTFSIVKDNLESPSKKFFTVTSYKCILYWPIHHFDDMKKHIKCELNGVSAKTTKDVVSSLKTYLVSVYN